MVVSKQPTETNLREESVPGVSRDPSGVHGRLDQQSHGTDLYVFAGEMLAGTGHLSTTVLSPPVRVVVGSGSAAVLTISPTAYRPGRVTAPPTVDLAPARNHSTQSARSTYQDALHWIYRATGLSKERIGSLIGVTRQTIANWENGSAMSDKGRRRLLLVREILKRAQQQYPTADGLTAWLDTPRGASGVTPAELFQRGDFRQARLLAVTSPSPGMQAVGSWSTHVAPPMLDRGAEHLMEALPSDQDEGDCSQDDDDEVFAARMLVDQDDSVS